MGLTPNRLAASVDFQRVASAIREKGGATGQITWPDGFVEGINNIGEPSEQTIFTYPFTVDSIKTSTFGIVQSTWIEENCTNPNFFVAIIANGVEHTTADRALVTSIRAGKKLKIGLMATAASSTCGSAWFHSGTSSTASGIQTTSSSMLSMTAGFPHVSGTGELRFYASSTYQVRPGNYFCIYGLLPEVN